MQARQWVGWPWRQRAAASLFQGSAARAWPCSSTRRVPKRGPRLATAHLSWASTKPVSTTVTTVANTQALRFMDALLVHRLFRRVLRRLPRGERWGPIWPARATRLYQAAGIQQAAGWQGWMQL